MLQLLLSYVLLMFNCAILQLYYIYNIMILTCSVYIIIILLLELFNYKLLLV